MKIASYTSSVCPECLKAVKAAIVEKGGSMYMEKTCEEHGFFSTLVWEGDYESWKNWDRGASEGTMKEADNCPHSCEHCESHIRSTCCALLEVTSECNMHCPVCFARSGGQDKRPDPSLEELRGAYQRLMKLGGPFNIQLSGGEPTLRDDLADIIAIGKEEGFDFFQLNTNGLRIASDLDYLLALKQAGLSCVYLQFDSFDDSHNVIIRGRKILKEKLLAISNCRKAGIGLVLVPTLVSGINDGMAGAILSFAAGAMPYVRGVHFQPASTFGRFDVPNPEKRITIPSMLRMIENQTQGQMKATDFIGGGSESPYCSFHASYLAESDRALKCLTSKNAGLSSPQKSRDAVAMNWTLDGIDLSEGESCCEPSNAVLEEEAQKAPASFDEFLLDRRRRTLSISGMLFMDAYNFDASRARQCHISEYDDGILYPFCAYNLTSASGISLYRDANIKAAH